MLLAAKMFDHDPAGDRRKSVRTRVRFVAGVEQQGSAARDVIILDLSADGFLAEIEGELPRDGLIWLSLAGVGLLEAKLVWRGRWCFGCAFSAPLTPSELKAALTLNRVAWGAFGGTQGTSDAPNPEGARHDSSYGTVGSGFLDFELDWTDLDFD